MFCAAPGTYAPVRSAAAAGGGEVAVATGDGVAVATRGIGVLGDDTLVESPPRDFGGVFVLVAVAAPPIGMALVGLPARAFGNAPALVAVAGALVGVALSRALDTGIGTGAPDAYTADAKASRPKIRMPLSMPRCGSRCCPLTRDGLSLGLDRRCGASFARTTFARMAVNRNPEVVVLRFDINVTPLAPYWTMSGPNSRRPWAAWDETDISGALIGDRP